jgi:Tol biopolymer transport system component
MKTSQLIHSLVMLYLINALTIFAQEIPADSIYFGFTPPGDSAIVFAPGRISLPGRFERTPNYYPNSKEFYFTVIEPDYSNQEIYYAIFNDGSWGEIKESFLSLDHIAADLSITDDGSKLCFTSNRGNSDFWNNDIWISDRMDTSWTAPQKLPTIINSSHPSGEWGPALLTNGNLYFCRGDNGHGDLYYSKFENGQYTEPVYLDQLNTGSHEWDPFVPEDESYIIFKSDRPGGFGSLDLYISYKKSDGAWAEPINLGNKINSTLHDDCGNLTPDGKYFLFARRDGNREMDIYWVSSSFISKLRPHNINPYLGQTPPGNTPEIFAEGILSLTGRNERVLTFTPDGKEIYFQAGNQILCFKEVDGQWQDAETASFIVDYMAGAYCYEPFISPDGTKLLFTSNKGSIGNNHNLWMTERSGDTWGEPHKLSNAINTPSGSWGEWHPCIVRNNNFYFARDGNIYFAEYSNNGYQTAVRLNTINSSSQDWDPYVDPDENYLIFKSNRPGGFGGMDNYISYRDTNGTWSTPQNLGENVNSALDDDAGDVSPDGKYFFFARSGDVYWLNAKTIPLTLPTSVDYKKKTIKDFKLMQNYPNPFNPSTTIKYNLDRPDNVLLTVYNVLGKKIETLVNEYQPVGEYEITWQPEGLASGVYFNRLQTGVYSETKKLILQK